MALRGLVNSLLKKHLAVVEEKELESQVLHGRVHLDWAKLRETPLGHGNLSCSGTFSRLTASWSWSSLLSSPVTLDLKDVLLVIRPQPQTAASQSKPAGAQQSGTSKTRPPTYLQRLRQRLCDELSINISGLHIRLEMPTGSTSIVVGLTIDEYSLTSERQKGASQGQRSLRQTAIIQNAGVYVKEEAADASEATLAAKHPDMSHYLAHGLSPTSAVVRYAGRRFVDWRGLEVSVEFPSMQASWTQDQTRHLVRLLHALRANIGAKEEAALEEDLATWAAESAAQLQTGHAPPQASGGKAKTAAPRQRGGLFRCFGCGPKKRSAGADGLGMSAIEDSEGLPSDISAKDRALLLQEEAPPDESDSFQLRVTLKTVTVVAMDSFLQAQLGILSSLTVSTGGWSSRTVVETCCMQDLAAMAETGDSMQQVLGPCPEQQHQPQPVLVVDKQSLSERKVDVTINPVRLVVTRGLLQACMDIRDLLQDMKEHREERPVARTLAQRLRNLSLVTDPWSISWTAPSASLSFADPWFTDAEVVLVAGGRGDSSLWDGPHTSEVTVRADLRTQQAVSSVWGSIFGGGGSTSNTCPLLQEVTVHVAADKSTVQASCEVALIKCSLDNFITVMRGLRSVWLRIYRHILERHAARRERRAATGGPRLAAQAPSTEKPRFSFLIGSIVGECHDKDGGRLSFTGEHLAVKISHGSGSASIDTLQGSIFLGSTFKGLVEVHGAYLSWVDVGATTDAEVGLQFVVHDNAEGHVAVSCPQVRCRLYLQPVPPDPEVRVLTTITGAVELDTSESFIKDCQKCATFFVGVSAAVKLHNAIFKYRPLGVTVEDTRVVSVSGQAQELGMEFGCAVVGFEPPPPSSRTSIEKHLQECTLPVTVLYLPPPSLFKVSIRIDPVTVFVKRLDAKRVVGIRIDKAELKLSDFELIKTDTTWGEVGNHVAESYLQQVNKKLPSLVSAMSLGVPGGRMIQSALGLLAGQLQLSLMPTSSGVGVFTGPAHALRAAGSQPRQLRDADRNTGNSGTASTASLARRKRGRAAQAAKGKGRGRGSRPRNTEAESDGA